MYEDKLFKINLPSNQEDYLNGNGEGVWACLVDEADYPNINTIGFIFKAQIKNDSLYYQAAKYNTVIEVESRGSMYRPVANYNYLVSRFGESNKLEAFRKLGWL